MDETNQTRRRSVLSKSHMPKDSLFYEKIVPILLVAMGVITTALILFAAGVLLGIVRF